MGTCTPAQQVSNAVSFLTNQRPEVERTSLPDRLCPADEPFHVVEQLRDDKVRASLYFLRKEMDIRFRRWGIDMWRRVTYTSRIISQSFHRLGLERG